MTKYNTRAAQPRHKTGITILESAWDYVKSMASKWGLTKNAALERIVMEHRAGNKADCYEDMMEDQTKERQRVKFLAEIERLVQEARELEDGS